MRHYKALLTGGIGFIESHLVDNLMSKGWDIVVLDNLDSGSLKNISKWLQNKQIQFNKGNNVDD